MTVQRRRLNVATALRMQQAMAVRPHSFDELSAISGLAHRPTQRWVAQMREAKGAHLAEWKREPTSGQWVAYFSFGPGVDAPRPPPASAAQRKANERRRKAGT